MQYKSEYRIVKGNAESGSTIGHQKTTADTKMRDARRPQ
jgi:hypothetical protein